MSIIKISNLFFGYKNSSNNIFSNINLQLDSNWKLGLIGRNGRGKTTLLKILNGELPYDGEIIANEEFEYFPYEIKNNNDIVINILNTIIGDVEEWKIIKELALLNISKEILNYKYHILSKGQQTKVLIAAMFLRHNCFMLIDEPTNHLDEEGRKVLAKYLKNKSSFILVSHDRAFLDECIDHVLAINKTNIEVGKGNFSSWWMNKKNQDEREILQNEKLKKEINRLEISFRQKANWADKVEKSKNGTKSSGNKLDKGYVGHKSEKMMKRAKVIEARQEKSIEEKSLLLKNVEQEEELSLNYIKFHNYILCTLKNLSIAYDKNFVISNFNLEIHQGDRICIKGKNGSGKSSILKLLCGKNIPHQGEVNISNGLKISYISQNFNGLSGTLKEYALQKEIDYTLFLTILRKLGFERELFEKRIENFSEGQKKKTLLAGSLCESAHLYIFDEPLNFIDVISRIQIENLILKNKPTMIFVEHDSKFSTSIATKIVEI